MKNLKTLTAIAAITLAISSGAYASTVNSETTAENKIVQSKESKLTPEEAEVMINRLHEIRSLNMNLLSLHEKKILRKEVRDIKEELKKQDGVVFYLSGTAIIIIILLLILL